MNTESPQTASRKRARSPPGPPFVLDYRPYTGRQLVQATAPHKHQWDLYYRNNTVNGYKDRHYILREFHELNEAIVEAKRREDDEQQAPACSSNAPGDTSSALFSWMEAGCGVGNAMLPVFEAYGGLAAWQRLVGFDISSVAIQFLEAKRDALPPELREKLHVCVLDPTETAVADCPFFVKQSVDGVVTVSNPVRFVSMVFVLCSIPVIHHVRVLSRIAACMTRPGGVFFFRDYAAEDQAQRRFATRHGTRGAPLPLPCSTTTSVLGAAAKAAEDDGTIALHERTYVRTNGTLSHFFTIEEVRHLFQSAGFEEIDLRVVEVEVTNHKKQLCFDRKFIQGRFRLSHPSPLA